MRLKKKPNILPLKNLSSTVYYRGLIAALDQGLLSLVNFGVQVLLIKTVTKSEFGFYSLSMSIIMYLMSFQNAVVNTPITVSIAGLTNENKKNYISSIFTGQFLILALIGIIGIIIFIADLVFIDSYSFLMVASIGIGSFGILNREFLRAYYFAEEVPLKVLKLDIIYTLVYLSLILILFYFKLLNVFYVIILMGVSSALDSLIINRDNKFIWDFAQIKLSFLKNWFISKWALIGITVTHIQGFAYLYVIGGLLGSAAMAEVSASRLLLMPLGLIINGWGNVIRPYGSKLREQGKLKQFFNNLVKVSLIYPLLVLILVAVIFLLKDHIIYLFLDKSYETVFDYLMFWAFSSMIGFSRANASYGLQVIKKFKSLALTNTITMIITLVGSFVLTDLFEIKGALIANLLGEVVFTIILWRFLYIGVFKE